MPSINQLIANAAARQEPGFDMEQFMADLDGQIAESSARQRGGVPESEPSVGAGAEPGPPVGEGDGQPVAAATPAPAAAPEPAEPVAAEPPPPAPPEPPAAPTVKIGDEEIPLAEAEALLALSRSMQAPPPVAETPPPPPAPEPELQLPDYIDPDNRALVEMYKELDTLKRAGEQRVAAEAADARQSAIHAAANRAGATFESKYAGRLDGTDLANLAQVAGGTPMAQMIAQGDPATAEQSFLDLMESTLWANEAFRNKVLAPPAAPVEGAEPPMTPGERKQALTGLSAASGLASPPLPAGALTARPDGRLDSESRSRIVADVAGQIRAATGGGF